MNEEQKSKLVLFQSKEIRREWHNKEWFYSLVDVVGALTLSANPTDYLKKIRKRDEELGSYIGTNCPQIEMLTTTGKKRKTLAGSTKDIFRLIQSIPSKKAEPFKQWLAQVGHERIQEIEDPELAQERMKSLYEQKGYSKDWIDKRLRGIAIRQNLTDEWKERGIKEHKNLPQKSNANLRDHMDDLELIFTMLGESHYGDFTRREARHTSKK